MREHRQGIGGGGSCDDAGDVALLHQTSSTCHHLQAEWIACCCDTERSGCCVDVAAWCHIGSADVAVFPAIRLGLDSLVDCLAGIGSAGHAALREIGGHRLRGCGAWC